MAIGFVFGRAGAGKTRYCVDALLSALNGPDDGRRLILLVPEQASFQMERLLATRSARGGYTRAAVLSFSRLARLVLAETGGEPPQVSSGGRVMALRWAAARAGRSLRFYRDAAKTPGFFQQVARLFEELLREQISPEVLRLAARAVPDVTAKRKIGELARVYREYLGWLGTERIDPAARLATARARLADVAWLADACIWVDGFAGFTGQELATLVALAQRAHELTITLLLDPSSPTLRTATADALQLFQRTERTYQRLVQMFADAGLVLAAPVTLRTSPLPRFAHAPSLARLEAGLATPIGVPVEETATAAAAGTGGVRILECTSHRDELRQAARFIRQTIGDSNGALRFRDFGLIARDLEPLSPLVAEVFGEYEIPYFLDRRRPMRAHPVSRLMDALFDAVAGDFSVAAMTRVLRTGLLPLSRYQAEELENLVVGHAVHGAAAWREPTWDLSRDSFQGLRGRDERSQTRVACDSRGLDAPRRQLVSALEPLISLVSRNPPPTGAEWARCLYDTLEALGVRRRIEGWIERSRSARVWERAETHRLAWEALCAVLSDLHDVLGAMPLRIDEVAAIVGAALREQTLGLAPPTLDQVLVSAIERSRHPDIQYAWLLAFNEGIFPARPPDDELLTTQERTELAKLGLAAPVSRREDAFGERLLAYIAMTRPSHGLTISYATVGADGAPLLASPLLDEVRRALPDVTIERPEAAPPPVCLAELAWDHLRERAAAVPRPEAQRRYERLCEVVRADASLAARLDWMLRGTEYRNAAENAGHHHPAADPEVAWDGTPSEIETYLDCSFKHWAKHGLRLDPARGPRPASWDLGEAAHAILADVTRRAMHKSARVQDLSDADWQTLLQEAVDAFQTSLPGDLDRRRPELVFSTRRLYAFLKEVVTVHAARWRRGQFVPLACEQSFGKQEGENVWPGLSWTLSDGRTARLHGRIDRIDGLQRDKQTLLLVYDYKSREMTLGGLWLTGARLQIHLYLLATQAARGAGTQVVGALVAPLYPDLRCAENKYVSGASPDEQRMYLYRPRGLFSREIARLLDAQLGETSSPVIAVRFKRDGDFDSRQSLDAIPPEQLDRRLELTRETMRMAAEGIIAGAVAAEPLVEKRTLACTRCEFHDVCRFDSAFNRKRPVETALPHLTLPDKAPPEEPA